MVGCLFQFKTLKKKFGYQHLAWQELHEKYGEIVGTKLGRKYVVVVFGEEAVAQILTREEFEGRPDGFIFRMRTFGRRLGMYFIRFYRMHLIIWKGIFVLRESCLGENICEYMCIRSICF